MKNIHNPIKYPDYEEGGYEMLTTEANDLLIELYKIYSNQKNNNGLKMFLFDSSYDLAHQLNLNHDTIFSALSELKRNGLISASAGSESYSFIKLLPKAIAFYERAPERQTKKFTSLIYKLFKK